MRRAIGLLTVIVGSSLLLAAPSWAVSNPNPHPPRKLTVGAKLFGAIGTGNEIRFRLVATEPRGWPFLTEVSILMLLHDQPIQQITFSVKDGTLTTTGQEPVPYPTEAPIPGSFLEIVPKLDRDNPAVLHQTFSLTLNVWAIVRESIPGSTLIRVTATNRTGDLSRARVNARVSGGFLSWGTLATAAAVALFLGALFGTTFTRRRYRQRQPSIWDVVERRLKEQRARRPSPVVPVTDGGP